MIHACYELALAMVSFMNMSSFYWYAYVIKQCFVVSGMSSQSCYHESVNKTCYVCMGAIIFSVPFSLMISKGVLFYAFSRFMPFVCLLWYVPVACCLLALNMASWCYSWHVSIFTKSVKLISFALLPCLFEPVLVWFSRSLVFMFCQASLVHRCHMLCCSVGVQ